jgi:hypothetical protein
MGGDPPEAPARGKQRPGPTPGPWPRHSFTGAAATCNVNLVATRRPL